MKLEASAFLAKLHTASALPRVLAIVGEEAYYRDKVRRGVLQKIFGPQGPEDYELKVFAEHTDLRELENAINTYPFFSGRTAILITDPLLLQPPLREGKATKSGAARIDGLLKLLEDVPDYCTVLLQSANMDGRQKLSRTLVKKFCLVQCLGLKVYRLEPWLRDQALQHGAHFTRDGMELLLSYLQLADQAPLQLLASELEKLSLYAGARKEWTAEDVQNIFSALPDAEMFAVSNALGQGNLVGVLELLEQARKKGSDLIKMEAILAAKVRRLLLVAEALDEGMQANEIQRELSMNPYALQMTLKEEKHFTEPALRKALAGMHRLNIDYRRGGRGFDRLEEILAFLIKGW